MKARTLLKSGRPSRLKASPAIDHWQPGREKIEAEILLIDAQRRLRARADRADLRRRQQRRFEEWIERRYTGEPVAHITGVDGVPRARAGRRARGVRAARLLGVARGAGGRVGCASASARCWSTWRAGWARSRSRSRTRCRRPRCSARSCRPRASSSRGGTRSHFELQATFRRRRSVRARSEAPARQGGRDHDPSAVRGEGRAARPARRDQGLGARAHADRPERRRPRAWCDAPSRRRRPGSCRTAGC